MANKIKASNIDTNAITADSISYPLTTFSSTGIDDNATSTAITIDSSNNVGIGTASPATAVALHIYKATGDANIILEAAEDSSNTEAKLLLKSYNTSSQPAIFFGDNAAYNGKITYENANDAMVITTNNAERMRITSFGNVGIGASSPAEALTVSSGSSSSCFVQVTNTDAGEGDNQGLYVGLTTSDEGYVGTRHNADFFLASNNTIRMNIASDGDVYVGAASFASGSRGKQFEINNNAVALRSGSSVTTVAFHNEFHNTNGAVGSISTSGSGTNFNTSSDYRLKENVSYDFDATTRLKQLKPARFNFIADADTTVDGFLAHEVQDVVPEAISGEKDETETKEKVVVNANGQVIAQNIEQADWETGKIADEDGNTQYPTDSTWEATKVVPVYQGIDQAKLVPLLVKTIQELEARITILENK